MIKPKIEERASQLEVVLRQYSRRIAEAQTGKVFCLSSYLEDQDRIQKQLTAFLEEQGFVRGALLLAIPGYRLPYAATMAQRAPQFDLEHTYFVQVPRRAHKNIRRIASTMRIPKAKHGAFILGARPNLDAPATAWRQPVGKVCELYDDSGLVALRVWSTDPYDAHLTYVGGGEYEVVIDHVIVDEDPRTIREYFHDYALFGPGR